MSKKDSNSDLGAIGKHIEKIVLGAAGVVCLWFLLTHVVFSPNVISYDGKKYRPGNIDYRISEQADILRQKLDRQPEPKGSYEPKVSKFTAKFDLAISNVKFDIPWPIQPSLKESGIQPIYALPQIGEVNEVLVEHIRAVAYVPTEVINESNPYGLDNSEPNDIDLVTVEAKFDIAGLYERFRKSFAGEDIQPEWRDPCLAEPVFAAVQLQRQQRLADGSWSDWENIPRTKIDARSTMFEVIEDVRQLPPGGMRVRVLKFDGLEVQRDLLQPEFYGIASAKEEWFPPSLHKKYIEYRKQLEVQEKLRIKEADLQQRRQELEERRAEREREEQRRTQERDQGRPGGGIVRATRIPTEIGGGDDSTAEDRRQRMFEDQRKRLERMQELAQSISINDIYNEFSKISITERTDFAKMRQPLVLWTHDDTVEQGKTYRYKIRLGVFNPLAGTNQFSREDEAKKNEAILWSEFSKETEPVEIPERLYFFANDVQEAAKTVQVQIFKYALGHWYSENFLVRPGETIGEVKKVELKAEETVQPVGIGGAMPTMANDEVTVPDTINYDTGAVLVDVVAVTDWSSGRSLSEKRLYHDMLYSFDGTDIKRMPIKQKYWSKELQSKFTTIRTLEEEPILPLRAWSGGTTRQRQFISVPVRRPEDRQEEDRRLPRRATPETPITY